VPGSIRKTFTAKRPLHTSARRVLSKHDYELHVIGVLVLIDYHREKPKTMQNRDRTSLSCKAAAPKLSLSEGTPDRGFRSNEIKPPCIFDAS
jgi:hypothetical protein